MLAHSITYFFAFNAIWSGENLFDTFKNAAWIISVFAIGQTAGYFISRTIYLYQKLTIKQTSICANIISITAILLLYLNFNLVHLNGADPLRTR
jgi:hypothetical protein